jgi:alkanesulfonate monooxygenase SsuD/methylene tetrahydromethanopterin reductase-like flavin-dependent oxidoreductase (luciferase family)
MRFGLVIPVGAVGSLTDPAAAVLEAEAAGFDLALLTGDAGEPAQALTAAAFVADRTHALRIVASAPVGGHPIHIAEQAAVADNALSGRLVLVLTAEPGEHGERNERSPLGETVEVVLAAFAPRPFTHDGTRWTVPGRIAGNVSDARISITPKPAQLELPVWVSGADASAVSAEFGVSYLASDDDGPDQAEEAWTTIARGLRRSAARLRRPAIRALDCTPSGEFDDTALTARLKEEAARWGLDVVLFALPERLEAPARRRAIGRLASVVRPHLQMDRVPEHVEAYWRRSRS